MKGGLFMESICNNLIMRQSALFLIGLIVVSNAF